MTGISRAPWSRGKRRRPRGACWWPRAAAAPRSATRVDPHRAASRPGRRRDRTRDRGSASLRHHRRGSTAGQLAGRRPPARAARERRLRRARLSAGRLPRRQRAAREGRAPAAAGRVRPRHPHQPAARRGRVRAFKYARYFLAPARARAAFGSDVQYERALAVGRLVPGGAARAAAVHAPGGRQPAGARCRRAGTYLVAAAQ